LEWSGKKIYNKFPRLVWGKQRTLFTKTFRQLNSGFCNWISRLNVFHLHKSWRVAVAVLGWTSSRIKTTLYTHTHTLSYNNILSLSASAIHRVSDNMVNLGCMGVVYRGWFCDSSTTRRPVPTRKTCTLCACAMATN